MKILVSNDDGYLATGINALSDALEQIADIVVVAPDRNRSAASNSLTLCDLSRRGLLVEFLTQVARGTQTGVDVLNDMNRQPHGA